MKKIFFIIIVLSFVTSTTQAWPWNKPKPKPSPTPVQVEVKKDTATIGNARQLIKELNAELQNAKTQNLKLKDNLERANAKAASAEQETVKVQQAADALKEWGIIQQAEAQKFMEKYNKAVKRYHRLKAIAAVVAAAAGVLLGLQFMALVPPPYNLGLPIGAAALFAALVWFLL